LLPICVHWVYFFDADVLVWRCRSCMEEEAA
jgi:hypothetical protein